MVSNYLIDRMIELQIISECDKEIYLYGLKQGFIILQNILNSVLLGIIFNHFFKQFFFSCIYFINYK